MKFKLSYHYIFFLFFLLIILVAAFLRLSNLPLRPMHTDEAVHALKFGSLLEKGIYIYDKNEYHGPTLNYLTLIPAWLRSQKNLASLDESTLRIIPAIAGIGIILLLLILIRDLGRKLVITISLLTAISPALVFYSRYYIQESLLVFFTFGSIASVYRFIMTRRTAWLVLSAIFTGLMHATKETSLISWLILMTAFGITLFIRFRKISECKKYLSSFRLWNIILFTGISMFISALFYSSFFSNLQGIIDSYTTYGSYFSKAGSYELHMHPWYYYLKLLVYSKSPSGMIWSEAWILVAAGFGVCALIRKKYTDPVHYWLILFLGIYSILLFVVYSAIPYKTPWSILTAYHGLLILSGFGIVHLFSGLKRKWSLILSGTLLSAGLLHLLVQTCSLNFISPTDPSNPYVYAQTGRDIYQVVQRVDSILSSYPQNQRPSIEVIFPGHDYWPLPWYLRNYPNTGYFDKVDFNQRPAPLIIASPEVENDIIRRLYELPPPGEQYLYLPLFENHIELRPMVEIRGYVRKDVMDHFRGSGYKTDH